MRRFLRVIMPKISFKELFVISAFLVAIIENAFSINQITLFNTFAAESWKSVQINIGGHTKTIEQHIVDAFNVAAWGPGASSTKINQHLNANIKNYYSGTLDDPANIPNKYNPANPASWPNNLVTDDSPRQWLKKLDLREIYRFKQYILDLRNDSTPANRVNLIDNNNYATDDLVKARALCGVFWKISPHSAIEAFSGMLVPNQAFNGAADATYRVHTCMHGFSAGNSVEYYFVPYGVIADQYSVKGNGFKVTHIRYGGTGNFVAVGDPPFAAGFAGAIYNQNDYAEVRINGHTEVGNNALKDILKAAAANNPIGAAIVTGETSHSPITKLPEINAAGTLHIDPASAFDSTTERLFIIGRAQNVNYALDSNNTAVCTTLKNEETFNDKRRSFENNENVKNPPSKVNINAHHEFRSTLATYPGMSGGAIVRCRLDPANPANKKCNFIGSNWGSERIFNDHTNQFEGFAQFVNNP
jgi:hypothetical protein